MNSVPRTSIARQLSAASLAINNTLGDAEILGLVAAFGYNTTRMSEGQRIYLAAASAVNGQTVAAGAQRQATLNLRSAEQRARASYQALAQLSRAVFMRNPATLAMLGLVGTTPSASPEFLRAANTLFDTAMRIREISATLASYGYDDAKLRREHEVIVAFSRACEAQVAAIGAAQQATRDRKAALKAQADWLAQYLKIARIALRDKPQLYEKLGGVARSARTAAQRQATSKAAATRAAKQAA
jgi:hypothetical protein